MRWQAKPPMATRYSAGKISSELTVRIYLVGTGHTFFSQSHLLLVACISGLASIRVVACCVLCATDGMLDCETHAPLPDYYAGILWSKLMGTGVLAVTSSTEPDAARSVRAYAHCAANRTAAVTVLLINLQPRTATNVSLGQLVSGTTTHRTECAWRRANGVL